MDKIEKLEQRWFKYKAKKVGSSTFIFLLFPLFIAGGYFIGVHFDKLEDMLFNKKIASNHIESKVVPIIKQEEKNITILTPSPLSTIALNVGKKEELSLEPIIPIIDMEREKAKSYKPVVTHHKKSVSKGVRAKPNTYLTAKELSKVKSNSRDTTHLKKIHLYSSSKNYIEMMQEKFSKSKQPREALLLAKEFYRKGAYKKSEGWALRANKIDSNLDESWIIFAQSKAKMDKKTEAIKILLAYYDKTKSAKVKRAIEKIKSGKI